KMARPRGRFWRWGQARPQLARPRSLPLVAGYTPALEAAGPAVGTSKSIHQAAGWADIREADRSPNCASALEPTSPGPRSLPDGQSATRTTGDLHDPRGRSGRSDPRGVRDGVPGVHENRRDRCRGHEVVS